MSKTVQITSPSQFSSLLQSSNVVVADFYADWCGPCKAIAPVYEQLSAQLSRPSALTFTKINTDQQQQIAQSHNISAMPTFLIFKAGREVHRVKGADPSKLNDAIRRLAREAEAAGDGSGAGSSGAAGGSWRAFEPAKPYSDITEEVDVRGLDVLNADSDYATARTLFEMARPSSLGTQGKGKAKAEEMGNKKDWMESDTDEQIMLYMPFMSSVKVHSLQITSLPPTESDDEVPMRPKQLKLYSNRAHNLGFEEADDQPATQDLEIPASAWDKETGTAKVDLRFVKFQNVTSMVVFVVSGDAGESGNTAEKTRVDRIRVIGETGAKRDPGKLEKVGHDE